MDINESAISQEEATHFHNAGILEQNENRNFNFCFFFMKSLFCMIVLLSFGQLIDYYTSSCFILGLETNLQILKAF